MKLPPIIQPTSPRPASRWSQIVVASWILAIAALIFLVLPVSKVLPGATSWAVASTCAGLTLLLLTGSVALVRRRISIYHRGMSFGEVTAEQSPLLFWAYLAFTLMLGSFLSAGGLSYLLGENAWHIFLTLLRHS